MMTLEEMRKRRDEMGISDEMLAQKSGVPFGTLQKILAGEIQNPGYDTRLAIERVLKGNSPVLKDPAGSYAPQAKSGTKPQGTYTMEDYYAWPEDERIELIDGVVYDMGAPTFLHQRFLFHFAYLVQNYVNEKKRTCLPMVAPVDVKLDERTMVQPDALILCDKNKIRRWGIEGAPDLVLEVLSKSTRRKDLTIKLKKYMNAGVREFWILDPDKKMLYVYDFRDEGVPGVYPMDAVVPVGIYDGDLKIPLKELLEMYDDIPD